MPYSHHEKNETVPFDQWVFLGASALAFLAGYVNTIMLDIYAVPASHMSGAVSRLGIDLAEGRTDELKFLLSLICAFFVGAIGSGFLIGSHQLKPGRRYGVAMLIEGLLLFLASSLMMKGNRNSVVLVAMACGLQNAMASSYYGLIIRTTHMTGIITDLGFMVGSSLHQRRKPSGWKFNLLLLILLGFFCGGVVAVFAKAALGPQAILLAALCLVVASLSYMAWHYFFRVKSS